MTESHLDHPLPSRREIRKNEAHKKSKNSTRFAVLCVLAGATLAMPYVAHSAQEAKDTVVDIFADEAAILSILPQSNDTAELVSLNASTTVLDARSFALPSRSETEREVLPSCDLSVVVTSSNGQLTDNELCTLWDGSTRLRPDAAIALTKLNVEFNAEFGRDMCLTSGYRSYGEQARVYSTKPGLAAPPGASNHGTGQAIDLCSSDSSGAMYSWFQHKAGAFGWYNPEWAKSGGNGPYEPWHWEFETVY